MSELEKISKKSNLLHKNTISYVFGSYAKKNSNIDIIVKTEEVADGFKIV